MLRAFVLKLNHGSVAKTLSQLGANRQSSILVSDNSNFRSMRHHELSSLMKYTISRTLYTEAALRISKLDYLQSRKSQLFTGGARDRYIERLSGYLQNGNVDAIYKDDLVNLIGIAKNEKDLDLIEQIVSSSSDAQAVYFKGWGSLLMSLYYRMNQLDRAYRNLKDTQKFGQFFNLRSCYRVLMTMLYDAGRYEDVLEIFHLYQDSSKEKQREEGTEEDIGRADKDLCPVAFASLAKMNNHKALAQAETLYNSLTQHSRLLGLRPTLFYAYLAVNNDQPKLALNLISQLPSRRYISLRELKIVSLIKLDRYEDILLQLREYVGSIKRDSNLLLKSTYDIIESNLESINDQAISQELRDLLIEIKEGGHVSDSTIEDFLFKPFEYDRPPARLDQNSGQVDTQRQHFSNYRGENQNQRYQYRPRRSHYNQQEQQNRSYDNNRDVGFDNRGDGRDVYRTKGYPKDNQKRFTYQNMSFD